MTTGATSKLTKKLLAKGFLVRYQKEKNRKEVYFRLTEEGERIYTTVSGLQQWEHPKKCVNTKRGVKRSKKTYLKKAALSAFFS